ncbi:MAG: 6-bladed beta-propeller [Gracilimonas sp.]
MNTINLYFLLFISMFIWSCSSESPANQDIDRIFVAIEELRIGQPDGDENYMFGEVKDVALGIKGRIIVSDQQGPIVRMYDNEGNFLKNIGREGWGPGEYTRISGMKAFNDGKLALWNASLMNINVYDPDGEYLEVHTVNSSLHAPDLFKAGKENNFFVKTTINRDSEKPNWQWGWLNVSQKGEVTDTLEVPRDEVDRPLTFVLFTAQGSVHAFIEWPVSTINTTGELIFAENNKNYEFELRTKKGPVKKVTRNFDPATLLSEEREQWDAWTNYYSGRGAENKVPEFKPAFKDIFTDAEGRIWVWRYVEAEYTELRVAPDYGPESNWWEPPTFDVFMADGRYYATVSLPLNANFKDAKGDKVIATLTGEEGEEYVVRYHLEDAK